jgi:hypothetical protein
VVAGTVTIPCAGLWIRGAGVGDRDVEHNSGTFINAVTRGGAAGVFLARVTRFGGASSPRRDDYAQGLKISDLMIYNGDSTTYRRGAFLEIDSFQHVEIDNVYLYAPCVGLSIHGGFGIYLTNSTVYGTKSRCDAIVIDGGGSTRSSNVNVVSFRNVLASTGAGGSCWAIKDFVQTVWWNHTTCETGGHAIVASCPTAGSAMGCPGFFSLFDFEAEVLPGETGGSLIDLADLVDGFKMSDGWLRGKHGSNASDHLIAIHAARFPAAGAMAFNVSDSWLKYAGGDCILVDTDVQFAISGNQLYGCSFHKPNSAYGVFVSAGRGTISGNTFGGDDPVVNDIDWPMRGIAIAGRAHYVAANGNIFSGGTGGHVNGSTTTVDKMAPGAQIAVIGNVGP